MEAKQAAAMEEGRKALTAAAAAPGATVTSSGLVILTTTEGTGKTPAASDTVTGAGNGAVVCRCHLFERSLLAFRRAGAAAAPLRPPPRFPPPLTSR